MARSSLENSCYNRSSRSTTSLRSKPSGGSKFRFQESKERAIRFGTSKSQELTEARSASLFALAFRSKKTLRSVRAQLYDHLEPRSSFDQRHRAERPRRQYAVNCRPHRAGIQSAQRAARGVLGRPLPCNRNRGRRAPASLPTLH
jgi:hypothetical protein